MEFRIVKVCTFTFDVKKSAQWNQDKPKSKNEYKALNKYKKNHLIELI